MEVDGQCHCGAIMYEADVEPGTIAICNCNDCQKQSGSAFRTNIPTSAENFRIIEGSPTTYIKTADSGARRTHAFCGTCGSPIYACAAENPKTYSLRVGALNQKHLLGAPARQTWTKRRFAWLDELSSIPGVEGQP
jgi:hypothetical protein